MGPTNYQEVREDRWNLKFFNSDWVNKDFGARGMATVTVTETEDPLEQEILDSYLQPHELQADTYLPHLEEGPNCKDYMLPYRTLRIHTKLG